MRGLGRKQWILLGAFALIVLVTSLFATRAVRRALYWRSHRDEVIRPWMTVPYVAHSYRVPPPILYEALNLAPQPHDRRPLRAIAREQNRTIDDVVQTLQSAIARERSSHPSGVPPPPGRSP